MTTYLQSGSMNYNGTGNIFPLWYGIDDDEIMNAMMEERERGSKPCWTSTYDKDSGFMRKRHAEMYT